MKKLFKNLKFVKKLQFTFLVFGAISTLIVVNDLVRMHEIDNLKDEIFREYVVPKENIDRLYSEFKVLQYSLMKLSIPDYDSEIDKNIASIKRGEAKIDSMLSIYDEMRIDSIVSEQLTEVDKLWKWYKSDVADGILSAGVTKNYEMAAVISVSLGEEAGRQLEGKFTSIRDLFTGKSQDLNNRIETLISESNNFIVAGMIAGTIVLLIAFFVLAPGLTKPLNRFKYLINDFALGDYSAEIPVQSKDEFGQLGKTLQLFQQKQKEKIQAAVNISEGKLEKVVPSSEKDQLAYSINREIDLLDDLIRETHQLTEAAVTGRLDVRGDEAKYLGGFREIIHGFNKTIDAVLEPINESRNVIQKMSAGDLTIRVTGNFKGDHKIIKDSINSLACAMQESLAEVKNVIETVFSSSNDISASVEQMAAGAQQQSVQTSEVACAMEEMSRTIFNTTKNTETVLKASKDARITSEEGKVKVEHTKASIEKIVASAGRVADIIGTLAKKSEQIGEITQVIDDIADQTNLLALNAAIEAARAGEQGRGFAVVADEVRKLAERTTQATGEIGETIKGVQKETLTADQSMNEVKKLVNKGMEDTIGIGELLLAINKGSENVTDLISQIAVTSEEQSKTSDEISRNVEAISTVTRESAAGTQQVAKSATELNILTENLRKLINNFIIDREDEHSIDQPMEDLINAELM